MFSSKFNIVQVGCTGTSQQVALKDCDLSSLDAFLDAGFPKATVEE